MGQESEVSSKQAKRIKVERMKEKWLGTFVCRTNYIRPSCAIYLFINHSI